MDPARKAAACVVALYEYNELITKYSLHLQSLQEECRKRRREAILAVLRRRNRVLVKPCSNQEAMLNMEADTFQRHFRVSKHHFEELLGKLEGRGLSSQHASGPPPVPATKKLLMFLWFMANQTSFREISNRFGVSQSSAHRVIVQVLTIMSDIGSTFISWPKSPGKRASAEAYNRICGLDGVIGALDGCHVRIHKPAIQGGDYMNRNSFHSVRLQGVVDEHGRFIDIFAGTPGSVDDARMLRASTFFSRWEDKMGEYKLLGDSAYADRAFPFIITPKQDIALSEEDLHINAQISQGRLIVDRAFGRLKCKWRRLRNLQNTHVDCVVLTIKSACFLHNLTLCSEDICEEHLHGCPRQEEDD